MTSFAELVGGSVGLVLDSSGMLAIAMDQRSAAEELNLDTGDQVTLTPAGADSAPRAPDRVDPSKLTPQPGLEPAGQSPAAPLTWPLSQE